MMIIPMQTAAVIPPGTDTNISDKMMYKQIAQYYELLD